MPGSREINFWVGTDFDIRFFLETQKAFCFFLKKRFFFFFFCFTKSSCLFIGLFA